MDDKALLEYLKREQAQPFSGWDFSHIQGRWESGTLPWRYRNIIQTYLHEDDMLLDMGTGGGEFLLTLGHPYHRTAVTESYPPNAALCKKTLVPLGILVSDAPANGPLPFASAMFDVVINRHESFDAAEAARVLKEGGVFIAQQVGGQNDNDLSELLIDDFKPPYPGHNLQNTAKALVDAGLRPLLADEAHPKIRFFDLGALVYFAKVVEWEFPGFSVEQCFPQLRALQKTIEETGCIEGTEHRFVIAAQKR